MAFRNAFALSLLAVAAGCASSTSDGSVMSGSDITMDQLPINVDDTKIVAGQFDQPIDHDAPPTASPSPTFKARYWYSSEFADGPNSPVLLNICGEAECTPTILHRFGDTAKSLHASLVTIEHRFYGQSLPFGPHPTNDQLKTTLNVHQVLEDLATFETFAKANLPLAGKWIAMGGSYSGMLAAFYREKHPEMVVGAWASSAPVAVQESFYGYDAVSSFALGKECGDRFRQAMAEIPAFLADPGQKAQLEASFLGPQGTQWFEGLSAADQANEVWNWASGFPMDYAQLGTNGPQICAALAQHADHPFQGILGLWNPPLVSDPSDPAPTTASTAAATPEPDVLGPGSQYLHIALKPEAPDGNGTGDAHDRPFFAWDYQVCTEMGFFFTANPDRTSSVMPPDDPAKVVSDNEQGCQQQFGVTPNIAATRATYYDPIINGTTTNIWFVNGTFDPWSSLSFTDPNSPPVGTSVFIVAQGHHHQEMDNLKPDSLLGVFEAHVRFNQLAKQWLAQ
jgi:hypothetical protein